MSQRRTVSTTARLIGCSLPPRATSSTNCSPPADQPVGLLGVGEGAAQVVDDLVGVAGEAVQRVDVRPLPGRQQQRREVVGLAVAGVEPAARLVRRPQLRVRIPAASSSLALTGGVWQNEGGDAGQRGAAGRPRDRSAPVRATGWPNGQAHAVASQQPAEPLVGPRSEYAVSSRSRRDPSPPTGHARTRPGPVRTAPRSRSLGAGALEVELCANGCTVLFVHRLASAPTQPFAADRTRAHTTGSGPDLATLAKPRRRSAGGRAVCERVHRPVRPQAGQRAGGTP
jgi:hypothetical protein